MNEQYDLVVIGAGPAGIAAATRARVLGLSVLVLDDQPAPGGQIWRGVETMAAGRLGEVLGEDYRRGAEPVAALRASGADYEAGSQVWQIEPGWTVFLSRAQQARQVKATQILLATGAQERPAPFPGWTLPGVMTVGAAQILLKTSRQIPQEPVWIAGSGPLPLLYMSQLLRAGGRVAAWLDTSPAGGWQRAIAHFGGALAGWKDVRKGLGWLGELRRAGVPVSRAVSALRAQAGADGQLAQIEYRSDGGAAQRVPARLLLVHEGVVPSIHFTQALGCRHVWQPHQQCLVAALDDWGQTSVPGIYVAGDGMGIGGAAAASTRGELAALGIALNAGRLEPAAARRDAAPLRARLAKALAARGLLDALYPPRAELFAPPDDTVVCRCEELTAGQIREAARLGEPGPNQIKALTRAGMGPCQGRQCGYTVSHILAAAHGKPVAQVGFYRIRPPLKPLTLGELASLDEAASCPSASASGERA